MRLTKDIERPELTERKYKAINTCYYNSPAACADKLGEYENIDESPEHLAKINKALEILKEVGGISWERILKVWLKIEKIDNDKYNLLKEVVL